MTTRVSKVVTFPLHNRDKAYATRALDSLSPAERRS